MKRVLPVTLKRLIIEILEKFRVPVVLLPLAGVNGSQKAIIHMADTMGSITVMGGKRSPVGAAAALLKDLIHACK